uniref:Thyroglobulin n=1 Tax=Pundamilia nyererei TaxID=303518 RepID=A0A3B4GGZ1_9CICH
MVLFSYTCIKYQLESETLSRCELLRGVAAAKERDEIPHCTEDGSFRPVQCSGRGQECWCVDTEGQEVTGTRTSGSSVCAGPSPCQLQAVLRCSPSGLFEPVQCDSSRGQCWCVDQDGMELYGTRQDGRPRRCPGGCEVRSRRLLHSSSRSSSPPQCAEDGSFLPVQCKFINTTDRTELDLLHAFNRFPEAFETFSSFRKFFPLVSSYCFCSDSRGRELENTGVELLLSEVYDSAFSGLRSGHSFSQTNIYRVLQRRMLGVRLALTGHFRCPSPCEEERRAAMEANSVFIPSCESGGAFDSKQCQQGGQCWCIDPAGRELPGTRQHGDSLTCSECLSSVSKFFLHFFSFVSVSASVFRAPDALSLDSDPTSFLSQLVEVLHGLFPSVGGALQALTRSSPRRFQENLFGGKFLKNAAAFNFSGAVGSRGALSLDPPSSQSLAVRLQRNQDLVQSVSRALEDPAFLSTLQQMLTGLSSSQSASVEQVTFLRCRAFLEQHQRLTCRSSSSHHLLCTQSGAFQEVQCQGAECWCVDPQGREVKGSRTVTRRPRCPSPCERARAAALEVRSNMAASAEIHIPACSRDGDFLPLQCVGSRCFCVDAEGKTMTVGPPQAIIKHSLIIRLNSEQLLCTDAVTTDSLFPPAVLQEFYLEKTQIAAVLNYKYYLVLILAVFVLHRLDESVVVSAGRCSQASAEVETFRQEVKSIVSLSNSSHIPLGYGFLLAEGLRLTREELQISQSEEELQVSETLLRRPRAALRLAAFSSDRPHWFSRMLLPRQRRSYQPFTPQCDADGRWLLTQCYHSTGQCWCVDEDGQYISDSLTSRSLSLPLTGGTIQTATPNATGQLTCPSWCQLQGLQCRPDGSFAPLQCDVTSCWCVSENGQEVGGTRTSRQTGRTPSCDRPLCPAPIITHGALVCRPPADGRQSCDLACYHGYQNSLAISSFLCETASRRWDGDQKLLSGACQISRPPQSVSSTQLWVLPSSCSQISRLQSLLLNTMTSRGLCSAQLPSSGRAVSLCDDSSVTLQCDGDDSLRLMVRWSAALYDLPTSDLPDLHDSRLLEGLQGILRSVLSSEPKLVSVTTPSFGCSRGYHLDSDSKGCVVCPAGSFSQEGVCHLCLQGTYQDEEGRDFCNRCPTGSSPAGASSVKECVTECQRQGLRCSQRGDFLPAQPDVLASRWRCFNSEGVELEWSSSDKVLTDDECSVLSRFQAVPTSDLIVGAADAEVLQTMTSDLTACVRACAAQPSCHHVALFNSQTQCELYSTHSLNTHCNTSQQSRGFLGNAQAELFDSLSCYLRVRGGASDLLVIRKKGAEFSSQQQHSFVRMRMMKAISGVFRTQVFSSRWTSLSDAHRFCQVGCSRDTCCDGFILNQNSLEGGSLLCGWLRAPSVLMCGDRDWDVIGQGAAKRTCGAGLTYNEQQRSFMFDFGGQEFTITDSALPADSKNRKDYQASIISFQRPMISCLSSSAVGSSVQLKFASLSEDDVLVDPQRKLPALSFWLNKNNYNSQQAQLWCLTRCDEEPQCSVADLRDADSAGFFSCSLYPDSRVCGAYDKPLRRPCSPLLDRAPNNTYSKKGKEGSSESHCHDFIAAPAVFKHRVSSDVVCLALISLGVQTCSEDDVTTWRTQDCRPSAVKTTPDPFGWYQKPVNQWSPSPALCPPFSLPPTKTNISLDDWSLLANSSVLVDPSLSTYDVIHVSRDVADDRDMTRNWCLHACQEAESCAAVSLSEVESATRCVLYPDTTVCGLSSALESPASSSCRLVVREPAPQVYLRRGVFSELSQTSVSIPGQGVLQGVAVETALASDRRTVVQFLGVPYARPPIGSLRFEAAQPAEWMGTWDATKPRPSCIQPGDAASAASSEDCLYLNIFTPRGRVPVLVFFFNPSANENPGLLDGSILAAMGNIVVVTASYRTAALGFLSTGESGLHGNYGLSDQEAALRWVKDHISLMGGDNSRVTVGAERGGADITSLHLLSSSRPLFQRMMLMGGSAFSPSLVQTPSTSRRQALDLAKELGCVTSDLAACLRASSVHTLNAAQTKLLAVSGPFQSWSPVRQSVSRSSFHRVDLLLGTSEHDGLISRARKIKDFESLQGRADSKTAFYEALSRSLGGATGNELLKEAAAWFYSLDHSPSAAGYNLFSRALNNATRDLFIICPTLQMARHWAENRANVFLYHQPTSSAHDRSSYGAGEANARTSESCVWSRFIHFFFALRNPNPSRSWAESVLPRWQPVLSSEAPPTYLELSTNLHHQRGLSQSSCSFWTQLAPKLTSLTGDRDFYWFLLVSPVPSVCSSAVSPEVLSPRSALFDSNLPVSC